MRRHSRRASAAPAAASTTLLAPMPTAAARWAISRRWRSSPTRRRPRPTRTSWRRASTSPRRGASASARASASRSGRNPYRISVASEGLAIRRGPLLLADAADAHTGLLLVGPSASAELGCRGDARHRRRARRPLGAREQRRRRRPMTSSGRDASGAIAERIAGPRPPVYFIGLDGGDWQLLDRLMAEGRMPELARLVREGHRGVLATEHPPLSPLLWTTMMTGTGPLEHGVLDFVRFRPHTGEREPIGSDERARPAIWNMADLGRQEGRRVRPVGHLSGRAGRRRAGVGPAVRVPQPRGPPARRRGLSARASDLGDRDAAARRRRGRRRASSRASCRGSPRPTTPRASKRSRRARGRTTIRCRHCAAS